MALHTGLLDGVDGVDGARPWIFPLGIGSEVVPNPLIRRNVVNYVFPLRVRPLSTD